LPDNFYLYIHSGNRLPPLYNEEVQDAPSIVAYYQIYEILPFTPLFYDVKIRFVDRYDIQEFLRANHLTDEQIVEDITAVIG
jgi:hypothetical protein